MRMSKGSPPRPTMSEKEEPTPICRCRVLYLGSAVPHITKDGLQGIQQPLKELYPEQGASGAKGIDSWLSVWSNGLLLENVDERNKKLSRFFPIESLHYCAAVRFVVVPGSTGEKVPRFLPLDSPFARNPNLNHPPLFACILRRTTGIKVLECHAFICKKEAPANALVRCCFHAYADNMYAKQIEGGSVYGTLSNGPTKTQSIEEHLDISDDMSAAGGPSVKSEVVPNGDVTGDEISVYNGDDNHKVWAGGEKETIYEYGGSTLRSLRSNGSRPRQLAAPIPAPPPPETMVKPTKDKKKKSKLSPPKTNGMMIMNGTPLGMRVPGPGRPSSVMNGPGMRPGPMMNGHGPFMAPPPPPGRGRPMVVGTYSERRPRLMPRPIPPVFMGPPPPGPMVPVPGHHPFMAPPPMMMMGPPLRRPPSRIMEEPIYMPSARPMSPVASYQPAHFPHEDYYFQYATTERPAKLKKKKKHHREDMVPPMESPFNTGIYKKKGHLNERAFSYSIRQEHRSRSYGSLSNLHFPQANGDGGAPPLGLKEDMKKEREILQMVHDLDLSGDEIERQEVPPAMYAKRASKNNNNL
ncbi:unnamed protein product [Darwinula stevensoni]|uniref:PID domain-containing protein n=1 Tax=Darwinula stevensoni TaxID=69355 RepID=A0A7R9A4Y0_9CRUS|nr:unnamed protein product [Darwinula stevensoni]CAG0890883.1 unnamed protein product [Darwinula stevensoni]